MVRGLSELYHFLKCTNLMKFVNSCFKISQRFTFLDGTTLCKEVMKTFRDQQGCTFSDCSSWKWVWFVEILPVYRLPIRFTFEVGSDAYGVTLSILLFSCCLDIFL